MAGSGGPRGNIVIANMVKVGNMVASFDALCAQVQTAQVPRIGAAAVSLKYYGGKFGSVDVLAHADSTATSDIGAVIAAGRLPAMLAPDVSAAPSAARTPPVISIFLNDILLDARQMDAIGKPERITAPIPQCALWARNLFEVASTRQLANDRCRETPAAYLVSVLPSSHGLFDKATPDTDFICVVSRYAAGAHVVVPSLYLSDAANTLPRLIRVAASTGVSLDPFYWYQPAKCGAAMPPNNHSRDVLQRR